jgi:hypothetical protein
MNPKKNANIPAPILIGNGELALQFKAVLNPRKLIVNIINKKPSLINVLKKLPICSVAVYDLSKLLFALSLKSSTFAISDII